MNNSSDEIFKRIKNDRPPIHVKKDGGYRCVGLKNEVLDFLFQLLEPEMETLETGCGLSTLLFALTGCHHTAIVPNNTHIEKTKENASKYNINLTDITFIEKRSEHFLPSWSTHKKLDAILIDGGHAFPLPIIDWFYTQSHLRDMGFLIVDDIGLKSVNVLIEFLKKQPEWEVVRLIDKTAFLRKLSSPSHNGEWDYWKQQPYNLSLGTKLRQLYYGVVDKLRI